jgi:hypothetical protein
MNRAPTERLIAPLPNLEANGLACPSCGTALIGAPAGTRFVVVGRSITGSQVHACAPPKPCAKRYEPTAVTS